MTTELDASPTSPGLSQIERVVDVFVAPSKTFKDILRSASCWLPIVLLLLSSMAASFVIQRQVGFERMYQNRMQASPAQADRINQMPPEQKANAVAMGVKFTGIFTYAFPVIILIFILIYSLILWASFNFGLGAQTTFPQVFAVTMFAGMPYMLQNLLIILTLYFGGNADAFDSQNPVGTNIGYYLAESAPWLKALLAQFDIIKIWADILQVIGMAIIARKTITQSAVVVGIYWLIGVVFATGIAAAFS